MKYYLHDTKSFEDEKITKLFMEFGYEGLGLFYTALEKLAYQEQPIETEVLKKQLRIGKKLNKIWKFIESLGIISSNNGESFNEKLIKNNEKYLINKEKTRIRVANFREKQSFVTITEPLCNTFVTPLKESKVKESNIGAIAPVNLKTMEQEEPTYNPLEDSTPKKYKNKSRIYFPVIEYYMALTNQAGSVNRYLRDMPEMLQMAEEATGDPTKVEEEMKMRILIAIKWHDFKRLSHPSLGTIIKKWNQIPQWRKEIEI